MCYNLAARQRAMALQKMYGIKVDEELARYGYYQVSGFSHPQLPVLLHNHSIGFEIMHWGLIPSWTVNEEKAIEYSNMALNAKAETIFEKNMFRTLIMSKRCILPIDGFYEWREVAKTKYPYFIYPKDKSLFSLGCIYDTWTNKETGELINTFTIVTTEANEVMATIHNLKKRMPLILERDDWEKWIDPAASENVIKDLLKPAANEVLEYHTISKDISHRNRDSNYREIQDEQIYPELIRGNEQTLF